MRIEFQSQSTLNLLGKRTTDINEVFAKGIIDKDSFVKMFLHNKICEKGIIKVARSSGNIDNLPIVLDEELYKLYLSSDQDKDIGISGEYRTEIHEIPQKSEGHLSQYIDVKEFVTDCDNCKFNNSVHLRGTICKPPKPRSLKLSNIFYFSVAVNTPDNDDYVPCNCKGSYAEYLGELKVGDRIEVLGRMASREYHRFSDRSLCTTQEMRIHRVDCIEYK